MRLRRRIAQSVYDRKSPPSAERGDEIGDVAPHQVPELLSLMHSGDRQDKMKNNVKHEVAMPTHGTESLSLNVFERP